MSEAHTLPLPISEAAPKKSAHGVWLAGLVIVLAGLAAYCNSLHGPMIFDDPGNIVHNLSIQHGIGEALNPPQDGQTVMGRPLVNLSLALNYASGGTHVVGYHVLNVLIHLLAGLTAFGLVRRTLLLPSMRAQYGEAALSIALGAALLWVLHPLQTESVTYISQRAESLMALFYLLTMYGFVRSVDSPQSKPWQVITVLACLLGMASKEVMVSAPLMVFLYDRTFVAGTFAEAWKRRWKFYAALTATWLLLAGLVIGAGNRNDSAGFGGSTAWWAYALSQFRIVSEYLWLSIWPQTQTLDYGKDLARQAAEIWPYAIVVLSLLAGTIYAIWRRPVLGFLGAWFFAILAPSSSVVPIMRQTMAEHRMYLPLLAVLVFAAAGLKSLAGRRSLAACIALATVFGLLTFGRNRAYHSSISIWSDAVRKTPFALRAHQNLGVALQGSGRLGESMQECHWIIQLLGPDDDVEEILLGSVLSSLGKNADAVKYLQAVLQRKPENAEAHNTLGGIFRAQGNALAAQAEFQTAIKYKPDSPEAHNNLGDIYILSGQPSEAFEQYKIAAQLRPEYASAYFGLGNADMLLRQINEASLEYQEALRLDPTFAEAYFAMGNVYAFKGQIAEAAEQFQIALKYKPDYPEAYYGLGGALLALGRPADALVPLEKALQLKPDYDLARAALNEAQKQLAH